MEKTYFVYLLASGRNGTLYVGVTNNLVRRVTEHKSELVPGFTERYAVVSLVWFETHTSIEAAIQREKRIKAWKREWKVNLFRELNPGWDDLYAGLTNGIWTYPLPAPRGRIREIRDRRASNQEGNRLVR